MNPTLAVILRAIIAVVLSFSFVGLALVVLNVAERKLGGRFQSRYGPLHVGWHGSLQTIADLLKILQKELIIPKGADPLLFRLAPYLSLVPVLTVFLAVPISENIVALESDLSLLIVLFLPALSIFGILTAGWASNSKYSLIASLRSAGQMFAYEVPRTLSVLSVVMLVGSLSLTEIVNSQKGVWFLIVQPIAFLIFFFTSLAEANRVPFDLVWAESELVSGFFTEYTGMRWAVFFLAEYGALIGSCFLTALLFMGGWLGPFLPPVVWLLIKVAALILISLWFRWTWPRFRIDQWLNFSWKFLVPLSVLNLLVTGILMLGLKVGA